MKKKLVMFTSVFASLAILSTGFAAWVITGGEEKTQEFGNIEVETIEDRRHAISIVGADSDQSKQGKIIFGCPATMNVENSWLINENGNVQKLETIFKVTVTNAKDKLITDILTKAELGTIDAKYADAFGAGYVGPETPKLEFYSNTDTTGEQTTKFDTDGSVYVALKFTWGSHFGGENPYNFYNNHASTDEISEGKTYASDALDALTALEELKNVKFNVILSTK